MIGIVGGVGPLAGIDLHKKIVHNTEANNDQSHLNVLLATYSSTISDRTAYIADIQANKPAGRNPGKEIAEVIYKLHKAGANNIGIPCNTAHAKLIWKEILLRLQQLNITKKITVVNMVAETIAILKQNNVQTVGIMGTLGTYSAKTYHTICAESEIDVLTPSETEIELLHSAIYDTEWGVKGNSIISQKAKDVMGRIAEDLGKNGASYVIMGCTEIPLVLKNITTKVATIDPTLVLARALIREEDNTKLKKIPF